MFDLKDLYHDVVVDHNRNPRHFGKLKYPTQVVEGYNPLCGDKLRLYLKISNNVITDISFDGEGCAISVASASLMTDSLIGKTVQQAQQLFHSFHGVIIQQEDVDMAQLELLEKISALAGVKKYPARIKCATLCWHALQSALTGSGSSVTTE